ncbi:MAG: ankyrin repeat domain-containing protein [Candidatus Babeliales bacterium]
MSNNRALKISWFICILLTMFDCLANTDDAKQIELLTEEFFSAVKSGNLEIVKQLITKGVDINAIDSNGAFALFLAHDSAEMVQFLINNGADVNMQSLKTNFTALMGAALMGKYEIAKMLLASGADVHMKNSDGRTALYLSIIINQPCIRRFSNGSHAKIALALIDAGADCYKNNPQVLISAVSLGQIEVVKALIAAGANVHAKDEQNNSALSIAYDYNHLDIVRILIQSGATADDIYHSNMLPAFLVGLIRYLRYSQM